MNHGIRAGAILAAFLLALASCKPFSGPLAVEPALGQYYIDYLRGDGSFRIDLDTGGLPRDVYFTFVNPSFSDERGDITVKAEAAGQESAMAAAVARPAVPSPSGAARAPAPAHITEFNQNPFGEKGKGTPSLRLFERLPAAPQFDGYGDTDAFYNMNLSGVVPATCRKVVTGVAVDGGTRTLNVWVADNCWDGPPGLDGDRNYLVNQAMIDALAAAFLEPGAFIDVYDWVTGMLGPEWGPHGYSNLIPQDDQITILLCDIAGDNQPGGYVGYYWSKDNFVKGDDPSYLDYYSAERIMFTIDAVSFGCPDGAWEITDTWPEEILSTLAHEFQHMIHFYQRGVLRDAMASGDTWINERASQVVEDLIADKMEVIGPRGVDGTDGTAGAPDNGDGRLPLFNAYNDISLSDWGGTDVYASYSIVYAFGAWLARNYGGAMLLNRLMQCPLTGPASVEWIVGQDTGSHERFPRLLQRWGTAQILSNTTDAPAGCVYNTGAFFPSEVDGHAYQLGSINLYNYAYGGQVGPLMYSGETVGTSPHLSTSTALYHVPTMVTGTFSRSVRLPSGMIASLLMRP